MKIGKVMFLAVGSFLFIGSIWLIWKCNMHLNSESALFVVGTEGCGWNTLVEKPTRINNIDNIWQISFSREGKRLVAFGNCEQPTNHWEIGDEVSIVVVQSDPSVFFSPPIYFFNNHRKAGARKKVEELIYTRF